MTNLKRRSFQLNQLLFSENIVDNTKNQESLKDRYSIPEEISYYRNMALSGFTPHEHKTISNLIQVYPKTSDILCIGGGCGREAFAFEKLGFRVTSLDVSEKMSLVGHEIAKEIHSGVEFVCSNYLEWKPRKKYKIIFLSSILINFIQGTKNRIEALKKIHSLLDDGGVFVFETDVFHTHTFSRYNLCSQVLKWRLGKHWEKGDTVRSFFGTHCKDKNLIFYHHYTEKEDVYYELKSSGFMGLGDRSELFWGFKK